MLVTCYRGTADTAGSGGGGGNAEPGTPGSSGDSSRQQQQQQARGFSRLASRKLLVHSVAPALQPDEEDV